MIKFLPGILLLLLTACAASGPGQAPARVDQAEILSQIAFLPEAQLVDEAPIAFGYPESALFAPGAVLPLPGGTAALDPLSDFFRAHTQLTWRVDVRAVTRHGADYDQRLAEKRSALLKAYLASNGVSLAGFIFQPLAAEGHPLVITLVSAQDAEKQ